MCPGPCFQNSVYDCFGYFCLPLTNPESPMHKPFNSYLSVPESLHLWKQHCHGFRKQSSLFELIFISARRPLRLTLHNTCSCKNLLDCSIVCSPNARKNKRTEKIAPCPSLTKIGLNTWPGPRAPKKKAAHCSWLP